jgi:hypothetical protein
MPRPTFEEILDILDRIRTRDPRGRHQRWFEIAGITIGIDSDPPIDRMRFAAALQPFEVSGPGGDAVTLTHLFGLPDLTGKDLGDEVYRLPPWAVYRRDAALLYLGVTPDPGDEKFHTVAVFDSDYRHGVICKPQAEESSIRREGFRSLTLFPSDQILVAQLLAQRKACYVHAAGAILDGRGLLFAGRSGAGKSTTVRMLKGRAEILCDDRIIVRPSDEGFRIFGTWHHGDVPDVSPNSAPLGGICFLIKSSENRLLRIRDPRMKIRRLLPCLIRPLVTREWWEPSLDLIERIVQEVPCFEMRFDETAAIVPHLEESAAHGIR